MEPYLQIPHGVVDGVVVRAAKRVHTRDALFDLAGRRPMTSFPDGDASATETGALPSRHRSLIKWSLVGLAVSFFFWLFAAADYKLSQLGTLVASPGSGEFISQSVMSIILGVLSAIFFSAHENKHAQAKLQEIYRSGPRDLITDTLRLLEQKCSKGLMYDETIEYILGPSDNDGFLIMRVRYSYKKIISDRNLFFRVIRLKSLEEQRHFHRDQAAIDALYAGSELFQQVDEVELREQFGDDVIDSAFIFHYIKMGGSNIELTKVVGDPTSLYCSVPTSHDLNQPVQLDYSFQFAVPKSDIAFGVAEFLTNGLTIRFVRDGALSGKIGAEAYEIISAAQGSPTISENPPGTHGVSHEGWVIPKSGAIFHWWPI